MSYVDLERQSIQFDGFNPSDSNQVFVGASIEPNFGDGGLDHNELAEIHAYRLTAALQYEGDDSTDSYALLPNTVQVPIGFGINMDARDLPNGEGESVDLSPGSGGDFSSDVAGVAMGVFNEDYEGLIETMVVARENEYLDTTGTDGPGPYAAGASQYRSGGGLTCFPIDLGVRGPVLDENDDISVLARNVKELASQDNRNLELYVGVDLYYRIHKVENTRAEFSLPP